MRRFALILALGSSLLTLSGSRADTSVGPIKCVAVEPIGSCGYVASGYGRFDSLRLAPWKVELHHADGTVDVVAGGASPLSGGIPSVAGDGVVVKLAPATTCFSPLGGPLPVCAGGGPVVLSEPGSIL